MKETFYAVFDREAMIVGDCYKTFDECKEHTVTNWTYDEFKETMFTICEFDDEDGCISEVTDEWFADDIY